MRRAWMRYFTDWPVGPAGRNRPIMKIFWSFVKKEFWHVFRDRRSLLILLGMPVMMILIFGFALSTEVKDSAIAVIDPSLDKESRELTHRLDKSRYFTVSQYLSHPDQIDTLFKKGKARMVVVFPPHFGAGLRHENQGRIQLIGDGTDPNTCSIVLQYASAIIRDYQQEMLGNLTLPYTIETEVRMLYNPQLLSTFNFVPGVMTLILMLLGAMMTSVSIVREKELGTMEVLLVSPMKPVGVVLSKVFPYLVLCFVDVCIILLLSYQVLGMPVRGNLALLLAECVLFIFTTLSLGLLISSSVATQQVAMFISLVGFMMPAIIFSGFMFPIENMPLVMQWISHIVPTRWFFNILKSIMIKGLGWEYVIRETLILMGMTVFFLVIAMKKFKVRLA